MLFYVIMPLRLFTDLNVDIFHYPPIHLGNYVSSARLAVAQRPRETYLYHSSPFPLRISLRRGSK
jgi:hypothetical protein